MADGIPYVSVMVNHIFENVSNIEGFTALYKALTDILPRGITISDVFEVETRDGISLYEEIPLSGSLQVNMFMLADLINGDVQPWMLEYAVRNDKNPSVFYFLLSQSKDDTYRAYPLMDNLFQSFRLRLEQKPDVVTKEKCEKLIERLICVFRENEVFRAFQEYVKSFVVKAIEFA
jgi:hypothetical protein